MDQIFDPFFTTQDVGQGKGQGLTVVRYIIVNQHNGKINIESQPGEGTTVKIQLPIQKD